MAHGVAADVNGSVVDAPAISELTTPPFVCAGARAAVFLYVHVPKAAGSSAECSLSTEARPIQGGRSSKAVWPFAGDVAAAARPHVEMRVLGGHLTFQDFLEGPKGAPAGLRAMHPVGPCSGRLWSRGGSHCQPLRQQMPATCTPMVTWLQSPAKRFVSAFYEFYGMRNRRATTPHNAELIRRYDFGHLVCHCRRGSNPRPHPALATALNSIMYLALASRRRDTHTHRRPTSSRCGRAPMPSMASFTRRAPSTATACSGTR